MTWNQYLRDERQASEQLALAAKLHKQQATLTEQLKHAELEIEQYEKQLQHYRKQSKELEKFSFINKLRELSGKKEVLVEENLQAAATTELKLVESQLMREDLQNDLVDCMNRLNAINEQHVEQQLKKIERQKHLWLMQHAPLANEKMSKLVEQELVCRNLIREIIEAIDAGNIASKSLQYASKLLDDAKTYSTWDTFLGGGLIATSMKHDKLKSSNSALHKAQIAIQRFQNELLDVQHMKTGTLAIETDGFIKFADYFFDDIFSAWSIHSKIKTSQMQLSNVLDDIHNTLAELQRKLTAAEQHLQSIEIQIQTILQTDESTLK